MAGDLVPDAEASEMRSCWIASTLAWRVSRFVVSLRVMAAGSARVGSAIEWTEGNGEGGAVGFGGVMDDEERLEVDTRLSTALMPKTAGPRLRSS